MTQWWITLWDGQSSCCCQWNSKQWALFEEKILGFGNFHVQIARPLFLHVYFLKLIWNMASWEKCTTQILRYDLISDIMGQTLLRTSLAGQKYGVTYLSKIGRVHLVGGFNPFEKYQSNWIISPGKGENKNLWNYYHCNRGWPGWLQKMYHCPKIEIEPEKHDLDDDLPLPKMHSQVPC